MRLSVALKKGCLLTGVIFLAHTTFAQSKNKAKDATPVQDTVIVVKKAAQKKQEKPAVAPLFDVKETVIVIKPNDTGEYKAPPKDTVIILKKGKTKAELAADKAKKLEEALRKNNYCDCVKMDIKTADVLQYETYITYSFIFKNSCKLDVWISSKSFRFVPHNAFGKPVKVKRKLNFTERYNYPDFVKIAPGETYTFTFSDDAFFEYDLEKGQSYKFMFEHRNFGDRSKMAPEKTYLCYQKRMQLIHIR